jgi:mycothiol synthase
MRDDDIPQLRLGFTRFDGLKPPQPVRGYGLRRYRPGDEDAWVVLLSTGEFGTWDRARLDRMLAGDRAPLPLAGIFFATQGSRLLGTACTFLHEGEQGDVPELGWVVVHPSHRGHGLGPQVCRAVLGFVRELGHRYIYLLTEDFRLPAIRMYLRLGFEPEMVDPSHPAWWEALLSLAPQPKSDLTENGECGRIQA